MIPESPSSSSVLRFCDDVILDFDFDFLNNEQPEGQQEEISSANPGYTILPQSQSSDTLFYPEFMEQNMALDTIPEASSTFPVLAPSTSPIWDGNVAGNSEDIPYNLHLESMDCSSTQPNIESGVGQIQLGPFSLSHSCRSPMNGIMMGESSQMAPVFSHAALPFQYADPSCLLTENNQVEDYQQNDIPVQFWDNQHSTSMQQFSHMQYSDIQPSSPISLFSTDLAPLPPSLSFPPLHPQELQTSEDTRYLEIPAFSPSIPVPSFQEPNLVPLSTLLQRINGEAPMIPSSACPPEQLPQALTHIVTPNGFSPSFLGQQVNSMQPSFEIPSPVDGVQCGEQGDDSSVRASASNIAIPRVEGETSMTQPTEASKPENQEVPLCLASINHDLCQVLFLVEHANGVDIRKLELHGRPDVPFHAFVTVKLKDSDGTPLSLSGLRFVSFKNVVLFVEVYLMQRQREGYWVDRENKTAAFEILYHQTKLHAESLGKQSIPPTPSIKKPRRRSKKVDKIILEEEGNVKGSSSRRNIIIQRERSKKLSWDDIKQYFHMTINEAAEHLKICITVIKKVCRDFGLKRWPFRKINSIDREILRLTVLIANDPTSREAKMYCEQLQALNKKMTEIYTPPNKGAAMKSVRVHVRGRKPKNVKNCNKDGSKET